MAEYVIRLPWPSTKTSPNKSNSGNWWEKAEAAASYKVTCGKECMAQKVRPISPAPVGNIAVCVTYHPPTRAGIDWDNMANRCKQGFDAVAAAIGVDDGRWWPVVSDKGEPVKGGAVVVRVLPGKISRKEAQNER